MRIEEYKPVAIILILSLMFSPVIFANGNDLGKYKTDGEAITMAMEDALQGLLEIKGIESIEISGFENLEDVSDLDNTFIYERFEDVLARVFSLSGLKMGMRINKTFGEKGSEEKERIAEDEGSVGGGGDIDVEEKIKLDEEMKGDLEANEGVQFDEYQADEYLLKYRLLIAKVDYNNLGSGMVRRVATSKIHVRIEDVGTGRIFWAGDIHGSYEDIIPKKYKDDLKDARYVQITKEEEDKGKNPIIEPLLVSGITAGLIMLFTLSARTD